MLLFPLIYLVQFSLLMAIEENYDQISKQKADSAGQYTFFLISSFCHLLQKQTNKQRETSQNMGKYNSTRVAVSKKIHVRPANCLGQFGT